MAYAVVPTAVTGDIVPAAYGNRIRDNLAYLKGQAGSVAIENSVAVTGTITATGTVAGATGVVSGPSGSAQLQTLDRVDNNPWVLYASGGVFALYNAVLGNLMSWGYATGQFGVRDHIANAGAAAHAGLLPGWLSQSALTGFLRSGTWTYSYNGDGTIASQVMSASGPLSGWAITYEYSGGLVAVMRLRIGGAGGTIVQSIGYTYDGSGRIATEGHS